MLLNICANEQAKLDQTVSVTVLLATRKDVEEQFHASQHLQPALSAGTCRESSLEVFGHMQLFLHTFALLGKTGPKFQFQFGRQHKGVDEQLHTSEHLQPAAG